MSSQCPKNLASPFWHSSPHLLSPVPLNALPAEDDIHDEAVPQEPPDAHSQVEPHDGDLESKGQEGTVASIEEQVMGYGLI